MEPPTVEPPPLSELTVTRDVDLSRVRRAIAGHAEGLGFETLARTRLVTAASELTRNMLTYAGGGLVRIETLHDPEVPGLRVTFEDRGPGIADPVRALEDGYSTGRGLGLGLGGARRLVDEFRLRSAVGEGTTVRIVCRRRRASS